MTTKHNHYYRDVSHLQKIDVYRVIELFDVTCPVMQHIIKKALCPGGRGHKDLRRDVQDIIDSATRKLGMMDEDEKLEYDEWMLDVGPWIMWDGSEQYGPGDVGIKSSTKVEVMFRGRDFTHIDHISSFFWSHDNHENDIIAYRIVK